MNKPDLSYLAGYPQPVLESVRALVARGELAAHLARRYPEQAHAVQTDKALYQYVEAIRRERLRHTPPPSKVLFDSRQHPVRGTLGTHTRVSRVQGGKLKSKNEIRIASVLREAPEPLLRAVVVHELAHFRESDHDKAFYQLCCHMEPDYHQLEFDLRLWLMARETGPQDAAPG